MKAYSEAGMRKLLQSYEDCRETAWWGDAAEVKMEARVRRALWTKAWDRKRALAAAINHLVAENERLTAENKRMAAMIVAQLPIGPKSHAWVAKKVDRKGAAASR